MARDTNRQRPGKYDERSNAKFNSPDRQGDAEVNYWLYDWIQLEGIRTVDDARRCLSNHDARDRLLLAADQSRNVEPIQHVGPDRLVAGRGADLFGFDTCISARCLKSSAEDLIRRTWHSFESVTVSGFNPAWTKVNCDPADPEKIAGLLAHVDLALHLGKINAYEVLEFSNKPSFCTQHLNEHAREAGLLSVAQMKRRFIRELAKGFEFKRFDVRDHDIDWHASMPALGNVSRGRYPFEGNLTPTREEVAKYAIESRAREHTAWTISNVAFARRMNAALGESGTVLSGHKRQGSADRAVDLPDIAFELQLPTIDHVPIEVVIQEMRRNPLELVALREEIRKALSERLAAAKAGDAKVLASDVYSRDIAPRLVALERRAESSLATLIKRDAAALTVGGAVATIGLLAFAPIVAPGLIVGAAGTLASHHDWLKEEKELKNSDLHFLWRLSKRA